MNATLPDTSHVECGYCSAPVPVNASSGEVREHKRAFADRKIRCIGSRQPAFINPGNLRIGDEFQVVGAAGRHTVDAQPTVPADSSLWQVPAGGSVLRLRGNVLLRLWTRQAGERS